MINNRLAAFATNGFSTALIAAPKRWKKPEKAIGDYLNVYNESLKSFTWTKTVDWILESLNNHCGVISETQH